MKYTDNDTRRSDQREKADRLLLAISWTLVGVFATSTILLSISISCIICCNKKSSPETTEAEPENIDNVILSPVRRHDRVSEAEPKHTENIALIPVRRQDSVAEAEPKLPENIAPIPVRNQDRVAATKPQQTENIELSPVRSQDSAAETKPDYENIVPSTSSEQSSELNLCTFKIT